MPRRISSIGGGGGAGGKGARAKSAAEGELARRMGALSPASRARLAAQAGAISSGARAGYSVGVGQAASQPGKYFGQPAVKAQRPVSSQKSCSTQRVGRA